MEVFSAEVENCEDTYITDSTNDIKHIEELKSDRISLPNLTTLMILFLSMPKSDTDGFGGGTGGGSAVWKI